MAVALIFGISSQDGSYLAELLLEKGYDVVGTYRRSTNYSLVNIDHLVGRVRLEAADLIDSESIRQVLQKYRPTEVYNLAAQSVPADSWRQPIYTGEVTGLGVTRILDAVHRECPDARVFHATSREIFGSITDGTITEQSLVSANNPYGIAKAYAHMMIGCYRESYGMYACAGILFNHESPRRSLHFVTRKITVAVACIKNGVANPPRDELGRPLVTNGKLHLGSLDAGRDWGYAKEYVEAMWLHLQQDKPKDYVIGTNTTYTVAEFCQFAFGHAGLDWQEHVETDVDLLRPTEIGNVTGDYSLAKKELGWEPRVFPQELAGIMVDADLERFR